MPYEECKCVTYVLFRHGLIRGSVNYMCVCVCVCVYLHACVCAKSLQSCLTLCNPVYYSPPGSSVHGILQARILEWVACPPLGVLPHPEIETASPALQVDSIPLSHW